MRGDVQQTTSEPVPLALRNAPTGLMKSWGYGKGYEHAHMAEDAITNMQCLPDSLRGRRYYFPTGRGVEKRIAERLEELLQRKGRAAEEPE